MIKISQAVEELIRSDEVALESFKMGILNLSAYAQKIQPVIEKRLIKSVKRGSIVVALSRIKDQFATEPHLKPKIYIDDLSVKSPIGELTYERTKASQIAASNLLKKIKHQNDFFTITHGISEITIIYPEILKDLVLNSFNSKPKGEYKDLVGITVRFNETDYIEVPNMIFVLVSALAVNRVNLIEVVSTYSEISFIVRRSDMQTAIESLRLYFR